MNLFKYPYRLPIRVIGTLLLCPALLFARNLASSSFYVKNEIVTESNIFEDSSDVRSSGNQLWFGIGHQTLSRNYRLNIKLASNLAAYTSHSTENKAINILSIRYQQTIFKGLSLNSTADVLNKQWIKAENGYTSSIIDAGLGYSGKNATICLGSEYQYNHFPFFKYFMSEQVGPFLQTNCNFSDRFILTSRSSWQSINYSDRQIIFPKNPDSTNLPLQKDKLLTLQIGVELRHNTILGAHLRYTLNNSNNPSAVFQAISCRLYSSQKIVGFYTQLILEFQLKEYSENQVRLLVFANPDPEQNIQNQVMFGWDRPLNAHFSIQGKLAYIKNETIFSNLYYNKWFASFGLMYSI